MAGLDIKKLRGMSKEIQKGAGNGDSLFLYSNKIKNEVEVRLLPPPEEANGIYFVEQTGWWVDGKFYLTGDTEIIGREDVINEEIELAKKENDKELNALISAKAQNGAVKLKKEYRYLLPALLLDTKWDGDDLIKCDVDDYKVVVAKKTLLAAIHDIITSRPYQNGTPEGLMNREKGYNMILTKTGTGLDTKYGAQAWITPTEMSEEWYDDEKMPNVIALTKKGVKSDEYLRSVIRNYLYGEDILEEEGTTSTESKQEEETKEEKPKASRPKRPSMQAAEKPKEAAKRSVMDDVVATADDDGIDDL